MASMTDQLFAWLNQQFLMAAGGDLSAQIIVLASKIIVYGSIVLFLLTIAMWIALPWAIRAQRKQRKQLLQEQQITNLHLESIDNKLHTMTKNAITLISRRKDD